MMFIAILKGDSMIETNNTNSYIHGCDGGGSSSGMFEDREYV